MVHPRAGKAQRQHQRRLDQPQRLVEVGGRLFRDKMLALDGIRARAAVEIRSMSPITASGMAPGFSRRSAPLSAAGTGARFRASARSRAENGPPPAEACPPWVDWTIGKFM